MARAPREIRGLFDDSDNELIEFGGMGRPKKPRGALRKKLYSYNASYSCYSRHRRRSEFLQRMLTFTQWRVFNSLLLLMDRRFRVRNPMRYLRKKWKRIKGFNKGMVTIFAKPEYDLLRVVPNEEQPWKDDVIINEWVIKKLKIPDWWWGRGCVWQLNYGDYDDHVEWNEFLKAREQAEYYARYGIEGKDVPGEAPRLNGDMKRKFAPNRRYVIKKRDEDMVKPTRSNSYDVYKSY